MYSTPNSGYISRIKNSYIEEQTTRKKIVFLDFEVVENSKLLDFKINKDLSVDNTNFPIWKVLTKHQKRKKILMFLKEHNLPTIKPKDFKEYRFLKLAFDKNTQRVINVDVVKKNNEIVSNFSSMKI